MNRRGRPYKWPDSMVKEVVDLWKSPEDPSLSQMAKVFDTNINMIRRLLERGGVVVPVRKLTRSVHENQSNCSGDNVAEQGQEQLEDGGGDVQGPGQEQDSVPEDHLV